MHQIMAHFCNFIPIRFVVFLLESLAEMPAAKDEIEEAREEGIEIINSFGPKEILTENGRVKGIIFKKCIVRF